MDTRTKGKITFVIILLIIFGIFFHIRGSSLFFFKKYHSKSVYVMDNFGKKVKGKNESEKLPPASLTKLLTALTAKEKIENLQELVPIDVESYKKMVAKNSSMAGFYGKEYVTYEDLLAGLLLASGGECAGTLAISTYGSRDAFVQRMNEKAKELGCENSYFTNPEGMDDEEMVTTAKDMAILLKAVFDDPELGHIITQKTYQSVSSLDHPQGLTIVSTVLGTIQEGEIKEGSIVGGKSGTTDLAGLCWATILKKDDKIYFSVTMGAPYQNIKNHELYQKEDTIKLLDSL